jgi:S-adenosylmethionine:tRNA-ribosyltransferase-isomerase (queuine synthetase)
MMAAPDPNRRSAKLLTVEADGRMRHLPRAALASLFCTGDLVIANDAATLPASLMGTHCASGLRHGRLYAIRRGLPQSHSAPVIITPAPKTECHRCLSRRAIA